MKKKTITFFLASSINDLEYDRLAVGDFVNQLNNIYESLGVFIRLIKCESDTLDHSIKLSGSQASLDELIRSSDMCFVIFWHKVGEVTFHELKIALESNKAYNKPKIVVYFKKIAEGEQSDEIKEIMHIIDEELLHYHREYSHIDSLKLGIITQLQVHGFVNADLSVSGNKIMCENTQIMTVDRIPLFADNAEYTELLDRYTNAIKRCEELQIAYATDNCNYKVYRALGQAVKERDRLKSDLDELTSNIFDIGNSIISMTTSGKAISENIRRAIKCFDAGDYDGVLEALDPTDIERNIAELDEIENNIIGERIAIVEEYRMRILALKAQARWSEVHDAYVKAVAQVENRPQMPKTVMYEYALFLFQQTQYTKCINICLALDGQYDANDFVGQRQIGRIENLCGLAYFKIGRYDEANKRLSNSLQIRKKLFADEKSMNLEYAESCTDLGKVYYYLNKHAEAEALYNEALSVFNVADDNNSNRVKATEIKMLLTDLYYQTNRHREAEEIAAETLGICISLADKHPSYLECVADLSARLAHINCAILSHRESDRYFVEALKVRGKLMQNDKRVFVGFFEAVCNILSKVYESSGYGEYANKIKGCCKSVDLSVLSQNENNVDFRYYDKNIDKSRIETRLLQALEIWRDLARKNPEAYESNVVVACKNLADLYLQTGELDKAEKYLQESIGIKKRLLSFTAENTDSTLAAVYCSFAVLYSQKNEFHRAEEMYKFASDIYRKLSFSNELARTYNYLGRLYTKFGKNREADKSYFESIALYTELYRKSPAAYIDRIINTLGNILYNICPEKEKTIMAELFSFSELG